MTRGKIAVKIGNLRNKYWKPQMPKEKKTKNLPRKRKIKGLSQIKNTNLL